MSEDINLQDEVYAALTNFLSTDEEIRIRAYTYLDGIKTQNDIGFIECLLPILQNENEEPKNRSLASIFLFRTLKKRTSEDQKIFIQNWYHQPFELREALRAAAFQGILSDNSDLSNQSGNLLGILLAIEFNSAGAREQVEIQDHFYSKVMEVLELSLNSSDISSRSMGYQVIRNFSQHSQEFYPNCAHDAPFLRLVPELFECILQGMIAADYPAIQDSASSAMLASLLIFKRHLSFTNNRNQLFEVLFAYLQSDIVIEVVPSKPLFVVGYTILRKLIDLYYPYFEEYMDDLFERTYEDLVSNNPDRQIEASLFWVNIGAVERDIQFPERRTPKNRHHEFDQNLGFSLTAFPKLFPPLVTLIQSTDADDKDANTSLDRNPQHAAFQCLSELSGAADADALPLIFEYVNQNISEEEWTLRYTSVLLLNAASQLNSFESDPANILQSFGYFVGALDDTIPRIIEVAMWSLGCMIERIPELVTDPDRFNELVTALSRKLNLSSALTFRAGWLFNRIFNVFSPGESDSLIALNFDEFSQLLLDAADVFNDVDPLDAAYGALNRLIEKTPCDLVEPYSKFLQSVIDRLSKLIEKATTSALDPYETHKTLGLFCFVEAIVMNLQSYIPPYAPDLIQLLLASLNVCHGELVCVVLPALGAVARALGSGFVDYLPNLLGQLEDYLQQQEHVRHAAVFVCDIYNAIPSFPENITNTFVNLLFKAFDIPDISNDARVFVFSALTDIARNIGPACFEWVEQFLKLFEKESRSVLVESENVDENYVRSFTFAILHCYQTIAPLYAEVDRGDRKVRNFFHIFDKLDKIRMMIDEEIIMEAVMLVKQISDLFGRKINAYTHKPVVIKLLKLAKESENQALQEVAEQAMESIQAC
ncbi:hypothetical protein TVAG_188290 [Trichomonas vaginalis G3]|uniref:Importin N-terminal domain-containing protein n=1 Tax=Trichomonas vaginalis (strain ATCC PRA-98 / G3) TaxID=412133 RepID=A2DV51_TRIV3|nr:ribosomal protein import into nucleus [Trichomonas vaginalis G3]EAY15778.1 hypothetical protein TVAG_188290 [Trichomonas vaginalis G3]KAI5486549.1 ribosomal protein import into nucleus [Trichomonas vaginalis G3]|eukprot:XP_001328001.1 hypothetical protein [Trichomonas vaginalis G3]